MRRLLNYDYLIDCLVQYGVNKALEDAIQALK